MKRSGRDGREPGRITGRKELIRLGDQLISPNSWSASSGARLWISQEVSTNQRPQRLPGADDPDLERLPGGRCWQ